MSETVEQIADHIESSRRELRSNLEELGQNVRSAVDWRKKFRAEPGAFLAVALGGGFVLATMIGGPRLPSTGRKTLPAAPALRGAQGAGRHVVHAWDRIQGALVGVVASKVASSLAEVVPGFREQLAAREDEARVVSRGSRTP